MCVGKRTSVHGTNTNPHHQCSSCWHRNRDGVKAELLQFNFFYPVSSPLCVYVCVCVRVCVCVLQEDFRLDQGVRLLTTIERVFARRMSSPEGTWVIYLSKPTHQQHQLLMNVASVHGTPTYTPTHTHKHKQTHTHTYTCTLKCRENSKTQ